MSRNHERDRRNVLKMASGITTGLTIGAVGSAAADGTGASSLDGVDTQDCDCSYEYKCEGSCYKNGSYPQSWQRECCDCDGDVACGNWERMNQCCL